MIVGECEGRTCQILKISSLRNHPLPLERYPRVWSGPCLLVEIVWDVEWNSGSGVFVVIGPRDSPRREGVSPGSYGVGWSYYRVSTVQAVQSNEGGYWIVARGARTYSIAPRYPCSSWQSERMGVG